MRLFVLDVAGSAGITGVSVRSAGSGGPWQPMVNKFGASWESYSQPPQPADLHVTTDDGQSAVLPGIVTTGAQGVVRSGVQLSAVPQTWDPAILPTLFNPAVEAGSTSAAVVSQPFGAAAQAAVCCDSASCYDINFAYNVYSCAQQKAFGHCNETYMTQPVKLSDATLEGVNRAQGYCSKTCGRCQCEGLA